MTPLQLHNTLTGRKDPFKPIKEGHVGLYVCGITPYDETHLGHARCYVVFDVLKRVLIQQGYKVKHIQNFTDVDDKIIKRANETHASPLEYPKPFMASFKNYMKALNVLDADEYPLVTTHMKDIIDLVKALIDRGFAYVIDGDVYYSVRKYPDYGKLSKRNIDELESGARVEVDERKKDPLDFALWKKAKESEPSWDSPWGRGRPGWHIECSAMSMKYLGEEFDIHSGGMDLIFPHHTNEIAQSVGASGKSFARVWMHNGFVTIDNEKMSKSLGNFFTLKDIFEKYDPMVVRYFLLSQHYRSPLNFSDQALEVAKTTWFERMLGAYRIAREWEKKVSSYFKEEGLPEIRELILRFQESLLNDLNTPAALGELNQLCTFVYEQDKLQKPSVLLVASKQLMDEMFSWLGLIPKNEEKWPAEIFELATQREEARRKKEWKRSDQLRDALKKKGVIVEDTPSGPRLKRV